MDTPTADGVSAVIAERRGGDTYAVISARHGISEATVGRWCRLAGLGNQDRPRRGESDESYGRRWIDRIRNRCRVDSNGCWLWQGFKNYKGYGQTSFRGKTRHIHRRMFMVVHGLKSLKTEQVVCHTCDIRHCCNPDHLWLGTAADNVLDSAIKGRHRNARKTLCKRGHLLGGENLWVCSQGLRHCKTCHRGRGRMKAGWPRVPCLQ